MPVMTPSAESALEREARVELAALYRAFAHFGWTDLTYTHLSARRPGHDDQYLIIRYGLLFEEVTASNLVAVDFAGRGVEGDQPYNRAGHVIHTSVLRARPELGFVLHSHTPAVAAVSAMACGILPLSQPANVIRATVGYHRYETAEDDPAWHQRLAADLAGHHVLVLHNHGLLTAGRTAAEAFLYHHFAQQACEIQVGALARGQELIYPDPDAVRALAEWGAPRERPWGAAPWAAVRRMLERRDPSFTS